MCIRDSYWTCSTHDRFLYFWHKKVPIWRECKKFENYTKRNFSDLLHSGLSRSVSRKEVCSWTLAIEYIFLNVSNGNHPSIFLSVSVFFLSFFLSIFLSVFHSVCLSYYPSSVLSVFLFFLSHTTFFHCLSLSNSVFLFFWSRASLWLGLKCWSVCTKN